MIKIKRGNKQEELRRETGRQKQQDESDTLKVKDWT